MKNMVSMEMQPEKKEKGKSDSCCCGGPCCCDAGKPRFPWGLQMHLEKEQLDALGMKEMPKVGATMMMMCAVKITGCSENEMEGEEPRRSVSLQVTDMGMEAPAAERKPMDKASLSAALYGNDNNGGV